MFNTSDAAPIKDITGRAYELLCTSQGEDMKTIKNNKDAICAGLKYKYQINYFQVTGGNQQDEDDYASPAEKSTQDDLISTSFKNEQMVAKMKPFYLLEGIMVPILVDSDIYTPTGWWDFDTRYNVLHKRNKVNQEQVALWCAHPSPIPKITYER